MSTVHACDIFFSRAAILLVCTRSILMKNRVFQAMLQNSILYNQCEKKAIMTGNTHWESSFPSHCIRYFPEQIWKITFFGPLIQVSEIRHSFISQRCVKKLDNPFTSRKSVYYVRSMESQLFPIWGERCFHDTFDFVFRQPFLGFEAQ